jgi:hypothetical protein
VEPQKTARSDGPNIACREYGELAALKMESKKKFSYRHTRSAELFDALRVFIVKLLGTERLERIHANAG